MGVNSLPKTVTRQADLQRIGISSGTLRSVMEYGLVLPFALLRSPTPAPACQLYSQPYNVMQASAVPRTIEVPFAACTPVGPRNLH